MSYLKLVPKRITVGYLSVCKHSARVPGDLAKCKSRLSVCDRTIRAMQLSPCFFNKAHPESIASLMCEDRLSIAAWQVVINKYWSFMPIDLKVDKLASCSVKTFVLE